MKITETPDQDAGDGVTLEGLAEAYMTETRAIMRHQRRAYVLMAAFLEMWIGSGDPAEAKKILDVGENLMF